MGVTVAVRNIWCASYLLAKGLRFVRAVRRPARATFIFDDPDGVAPALMRRFRDDADLHRLIDARRAMSQVLDLTYERAVCEAADVASELALVPAVETPP